MFFGHVAWTGSVQRIVTHQPRRAFRLTIAGARLRLVFASLKRCLAVSLQHLNVRCAARDVLHLFRDDTHAEPIYNAPPTPQEVGVDIFEQNANVQWWRLTGTLSVVCLRHVWRGSRPARRSDSARVGNAGGFGDPAS